MGVLHGLHLHNDMYLKKNSFLCRFLSLYVLFTLGSCQNDIDDPLVWSHYDVKSTYSIRSFEVSNGELLAFGGETWSLGLELSFDGDDVVTDSLSPTIILDTYLSSGSVSACGPYYVLNSDDVTDWNTYQLDNFDIARSCVVIDDKLVSVGGLGFDFGTIYTHNLTDNSLIRFTLSHTLEKLILYQDRLVAVGYGIVLISHDLGITWELTPLEGGHFVDAEVIENELYILDTDGSLLITNAELSTWDREVKLGTSDITDFLVLQSDEIVFANLYGELYVHSKSSGIEVLATFDHAIRSLFAQDGKLYIGGDGGLLASTNI